MNLKNKAIALFACLVLCTSFVPVLALADPIDDEVIEADGVELTSAADDGVENVELTVQASQGQLDFKGAKSVSGNTVSYEGGYTLTLTYSGTGTWNGTSLTLPDEETVTFQFAPPSGYSGNASLVIDGNQVAFNGGVCSYTTDFSSKTGITVEFDPGVGPQATREVKLTLDNASLPMLAQKCTLKIGYGDDNDVVFDASKNGEPVTVSEDTLKRTLLAFTIDTRYFIPTAIVNGKTFETFDEGTTPGDSSRVNIVVELEGDDAAADEFNVNLSIGAQANVSLQAQSINGASASYMLVEDGKALVGDVANTEIDLAINDAAVDSAVDGAVATFDIDAQVNGQAATATEAPLNITMGLDTSVYTASDYVVVRNHEGTITELDTTYDAATGRLSFASDQFSDYSLVDKSAAPADIRATSQTKLAATSDPLTAGSMVVISIAAFVAAVFATRKLREQQ